MNIAAYGIPWIPTSLVKQFLSTDWKLLDYSGNKITYEEVRNEKPSAILSFNPPSELLDIETVKWLISPGAGIDGMPLEKIKKSGQRIINCHANSISVAEHAWSLLLSTAKQIVKYDFRIRKEHKWPDTNQIKDVNSDLFDKTIGVVGYGAIGKIIESYATAFGMEPIIFRKNPEGEDQYSISEFKDLADELDYLLLACPLTNETRGMINKEILDKLPSHSILVNIARGELIIEEDLFDALREGTIRSAGLDVWQNSPYSGGEGSKPSVIIDVPNLVISPHRAWVSKQSYGMVAKKLAEELDLIAKNKTSINEVDLERGY